MDSRKIGNLGEKIAESFLKKKGYQILDKNYSNKFVSGPQRGEIDLITKKEDVISFIEVKALSESNQRFLPEDKVNFPKQRKIIKTAQNWFMEKRIPAASKWQIDIISIKINQNTNRAKIRHLKNVGF